MKSVKVLCLVFGAVSLLSIASVASEVEVSSDFETAEGLRSKAADQFQPFVVDESIHLKTDGYVPYAGQFPYHAQVNAKTANFLEKRAGALITPNYVLMPAYFLYQAVYKDQLEYGFVVLGSMFDGNTQWEQRINFTKSGIIIHPFYQHYTQDYYNIAAIRLERSATVNRYVQPIRLPKITDFRTYELMEGTACGSWNEASLRYLRNQLMPLTECQQQLTSYTISAQHICTDAYRGGAFCNRQYGSSLTIEDENGRVLVGLVDFAYVCIYNLPVRHIRVSYFREWIQLNTDYRFDAVSFEVNGELEAKEDVKAPAVASVLPAAVPEEMLNISTYGYLAYPGQFPYHAEISFKIQLNDYFFTCAGALITANYVLTTARCLHINVGYSFDYGFVTLGSSVHGNTMYEQHINFTRDAFNIHPFHTYGTYNVATIRLERSATLNKYVQPLRLPTLSDVRTYELMEGVTTGTQRSVGLKYLRNQVISNEECDQTLPNSYITAQDICTNTYMGGAFCTRQHGAALTLPDGNGWLLIGLTDKYYTCIFNYPAQFVRVSYFSEWIKLNTDYQFEMKLFKALFVLSVVFVSTVGRVRTSDVKQLAEEESVVKYELTSLGTDQHQSRNVEVDERIATDGYFPFPGQFPYHALIYVELFEFFPYLTHGSLITPNYILTVAMYLHHDIRYGRLVGGNVCLGSWELNGNTDWQQLISFAAGGVNIHPFFNLQNDLYNIATIRLDYSALLNEYVQPIRLPRLSDTRTYAMMEGTMIGALHDYTGSRSTYIRNQVISNDDSQRELPDTAGPHICTNPFIGGSLRNKRLGSSLTIEDENGLVLVGLTYYYYTNFVRHVRVSFFRDWIQMNTDYRSDN
uniref:Peptidase S1 domain-containing protein n=1 Tax=Anopheles christyi TaxID=43041 RepID=A0A182K5F0_9DIPT